jgi:hypothetical protein
MLFTSAAREVDPEVARNHHAAVVAQDQGTKPFKISNKCILNNNFNFSEADLQCLENQTVQISPIDLAAEAIRERPDHEGL